MTALDLSEAWAAWVNAHDKVIGGRIPGPPEYFDEHVPLEHVSVVDAQADIESFGESLLTHTPSQQGRYAESGPFCRGEHWDRWGVRAGRCGARGRPWSRRVDWLKAGEMSSLMSEISADLGLTGILFAKKGGFNKGQKQQWLYAFQRGDFAKIKELEKQSGNDNPLLDSLPDSVAWRRRS